MVVGMAMTLAQGTVMGGDTPCRTLCPTPDTHH